MTEKEKKTKKDSGSKEYMAIILVRSLCKVRADIKDTLSMLGLTKKHAMTIREKNPVLIGMVKKVKDYVTYGVVPESYVKEFGEKTTAHLHPPRGGFERKGIKVPFSTGGVLGNRGEKIVELIDKMKK